MSCRDRRTKLSPHHYSLFIVVVAPWLSLPALAQVPILDSDNPAAIAQLPEQNFTYPPSPKSTNLNFRDQSLPLSIFTPPRQPDQTSTRPLPTQQKTQSESHRPSLRDLMRLEPAPLPSFVYNDRFNQ